VQPLSSRAEPAAAGAEFECDVLVVGGGPAGSTIAALLAEAGRDVVVVEKAHHPRFHIGESLLPANAMLFDKLGVRQQVEAIGMQKYGVEFVSPDHEHRQFIEVGEAWDKSMPYAWQVRRSELDELLFRDAAKKGARTFEGQRVREVAFDAEGALAQVELEDGTRREWRAKFIVDASGRDTLLANQLRCKEKNKRHNSSALYGHFTGAERLPGKLEGNITIFWFEHGWFWLIPLADGVTSIGAVVWPHYLKSRAKPVKDFFLDTIALCPALAERLAHATLASEVEATGNFSYACERTHGPNYLLVGDAYAFIDPVFSSGVMLAMQGGFVGAETVDTCLRQPAQAAAALARFDREARRGPKEFSWFIYRVTHPTMRDMFMAPSNVLRVKEALLSMLAGDIYGKTPIWGSIAVLKAIFYIGSALNLKRSLVARRLRKANIREVEAAAS